MNNFKAVYLIFLSWRLLYRYSQKRTYLLAIIILLISIFELLSLVFVYPLLKYLLTPGEAISLSILDFLPVKISSSIYMYIVFGLALFFVIGSSALRISGINLFAKYSFNVAKQISTWRFDYLTKYFKSPSQSMHSASTLFQEAKEFPASLPMVLIIPSIQIPQALFSLSVILTFTIFASFTSSFLILVFIASLYFILYSRIKPRLYYYGKQVNSSSKKIADIINNFSAGWQEIFAYNITETFRNNLVSLFALHSNYNYKTYTLSGAPKILIESLLLAAILLCAFSSVVFKVNIIAGIALVAFALLKSLPYMQTMLGAFSCLANNNSMISSLELESYLSPTPHSPSAKKVYHVSSRPVSSLVIDISDLQLSFLLPSNASLVLRDRGPMRFTTGRFHLDRYAKVALIGPSGSGKSLLLDYFAGVRTPRGQLVYRDIYDSYCAYSTQSPMIAPFSLPKNITLGVDEKDIEEIKRTIPKVLDFLELSALFQKHKTEQLLQSSNLSGGEAQRLSIARSLLSTAPMVILDEPTSPLHPALADKFLTRLPSFIKDRFLVVSLHSNRIPVWIDAIIELT